MSIANIYKRRSLIKGVALLAGAIFFKGTRVNASSMSRAALREVLGSLPAKEK